MSITPDGNVGVGEVDPLTRFQVSADGVTTNPPGAPFLPEDYVALIKDTNFGFTTGLAIQSGQNPPLSSANHNFITFFSQAGTSVGSIEGNGGNGVQLGGPGSDYAEYLLKADPTAEIDATEIVGVRNGRIVGHAEEADQYMVVTGQAIIAGNRPSEDQSDLDARELVSFVGQVPVQVRGPVSSGDFILASEDRDGTGVAMDASEVPPSEMYRIVGRAWESSSDVGLKTVNTAVGLDQTSLMAPALERLERENAELRAANSALEARVTRLESVETEVASLKAALATLLENR